LVLFLLIACYGVGDSLAFVTCRKLHSELFKLIFSVCLINELKKRRQSMKCVEAAHRFSADL